MSLVHPSRRPGIIQKSVLRVNRAVWIMAGQLKSINPATQSGFFRYAEVINYLALSVLSLLHVSKFMINRIIEGFRKFAHDRLGFDHLKVKICGA